jgi:uncharacterized NAD-dependent epimerase/dehydratase family protein
MTGMLERRREIPRPYLIFVGDIEEPLDAKTALGLVEWRPDWCAGQARLTKRALDLGLPELSFAEAAARGIKTVVLGGAPFGGRLPPAWIAALEEALRHGLSLAAGLHDRLGGIASLRELAAWHGGQLIDIREPPPGFVPPVASGRPRPGRRVLTVGLDCAIGKKFTALQLEKDLRASGAKASFRASGQTGILISGGGIAIDAVVADFVAGVAELLSPANEADHWDVIEGQGSLFHPAYAGVSLGLLHGSQPDAIVLCHEATRTHLDGYPDFPIVDIETGIERHLEMARLTNPDVRCAGISLQTARLPEDERLAALEAMEQRTGLACVDPAVTGTGRLVEALAAIPPKAV